MYLFIYRNLRKRVEGAEFLTSVGVPPSLTEKFATQIYPLRVCQVRILGYPDAYPVFVRSESALVIKNRSGSLDPNSCHNDVDNTYLCLRLKALGKCYK